MEHAWGKEIENILHVGMPLHDVGVNNWALTRNEAMAALDQLLALRTPLLGGDVYFLINGTLQSNYDNWYCEPYTKETKESFANRSIAEAKKYIDSYFVNNGSYSPFFVLIPDM